MDRKFLDTCCERAILGLVLALIVFAPLAFGAVPDWAFAVLQGIVAVALLLWGLRWWLGTKPQLLWPPLCWVVSLFALLAVGRYLLADIEYIARLEMLQVLVFAGLFFLIINNLYRQEAVQSISGTLIVVATGVASYAIFQWITHSNLVWHTPSPYIGRPSGTYISPNNLAGLLGMVLPLALAFLLAGRMPVVVRILVGYAIVIMLLGEGVTFSRGGWAGALTGLLAVFVILATHRKHRWGALSLLLVLSIGVGLFGVQYLSKSEGYKTHIKNIQTVEVLNLDIRLELWKSAEKMWQDHFWWGVGPGLFDYRFREYRPEVVQNRPEHVHNDYLNLLTDWGTIGGVVVLSGIILFMVSLVKTWRHVRRSENDFSSGQSNRFAFYVGAMGAILALTVHSVVDFNLHIPANAMVAVILLALLMSNLRFATEKYWVNLRLPLKLAGLTVLVALAGYFFLQTWQREREARWLQAAMQNPDPFSAGHMTALKTAFAIENKNFDTAYNIGEAYRLQSMQGGEDYQAQADSALQWYAQSTKLNPWEGYNYLRTGICLDWLEKYDSAAAAFKQAETLDPNGYYTVAYIGWHYVQVGDDAAARQYFLRSLWLQGHGNDIADNYLRLTEERMANKAANPNALPFGF